MKTIFDKVFKLAKNSRDSRNLILNSIIKTPCLRSRLKLDEERELYFKAENFQYTGSFKLRGALSKIKKVEKNTKLITASSGNHGIACSHAAKVTGHNLTVVLPEKVSKSKLELIKGYGTKIILNPGDSGLAEKHARSLAENGEFDYISPYNDIDIIAGQGTIGFELLEQLPKIDNVYISMGGGGLISGIGSVIKYHSPKTKIIGVSAKNSGALSASLKLGKVCETTHLDTLADGCAGGIDEDTLTLPLAKAVIDSVIDCTEELIIEAIKILAWHENLLVEGSAALALAGFLQDKNSEKRQVSLVLLCGGNFDKDLLLPILN